MASYKVCMRRFFFCQSMYWVLTFFFLPPPSIASGKLYFPWFRWPARLSLFHPTSRSPNNVHHPKDQVRMEKNQCSSDPNSCPRPQEPPKPANSGKEDREDLGEIHRLMQNPVLYDPLRAPRYPVVLCHGAPLLAPCSTGRHSTLIPFQVCMVLTSVGHRRFRACGCSTGQPSSISCARRSEQRLS